MNNKIHIPVKIKIIKNAPLKAMHQLDHVTSVIGITVCKVILKIITKMDFRYQRDVNKRAKKVCLVPNIFF